MKELKAILRELRIMKKLLILVASQTEITQPEIGKALGVSARQVRNILARR